MAGVADKTNPELWDKVKKKVTDGDKGGRPGQWSARKAQLAVADYKKEGGGYRGRKQANNHLTQWTREEWGTKSGQQSGETGERYLPKKARAHLSDAEYARTTRKKQADTRQGRQFSAQPKDIAAKTSGDRDTGRAAATRRSTLDSLPRAELVKRATRLAIPNRGRMRKAELIAALRRAKS